jgi:8-oxo-dGTP pyrophosphatase MutT (NUDIX family)
MDLDKSHYVVVTGIIIKNGKFLITKRSSDKKAFPGLWTVPGGKLELKDYKNKPKDTSSHWYNIFENLLRREVMEETGLSINNINYLTSLAFIRPDGVPTIVISLFADYATGVVKLNEESEDYAWVSLEEAKNYELIEGIYEELEMLDKHLRGEKIKEWTLRKI